ncbi:hypothetical protein LMJF_34_3745 [Leishmania major strain Friedlin]|uniref:Uncharacterized protein n=1 Tax=Leishmania major TaxID=5664 RepID=Q4Q2G9_LEIMA|nr:hypothetical protein LMJF_34_3745 [Leishmania major strain Friedlin]CAG9582253.1 hypothetical_protein_-_conserved [Leishmania major strain Friedlin]CAJ08096.1 hypothetical protein LMJF_34_3745 [Leishmania major strain Friedlin]|eukprot:XP_001686479.1 hypothetical protein LMJF_34_3745 [Leishmania major strain Friedlin]
MALPPVLHVGPHELKLFPICRSAEVAPGRHRCNDSLLTRYCFVGELQTDADGRSVADVAAGRGSNCRTATILWCYSPLFQFEHKRIRVEEGVIEAALTKEVTARQHADVNSPSLKSGGAEAVKHKDSYSTSSSKASSAAPSVTSATGLPAVYLRVGNSTTFREYRLVTEGRHSTALGASTELRAPSDASIAGDGDGVVSVHEAHKPPTLRPLAPRRPTLRPIDTRPDGNSLRSMARLAHKQNAALRRCGAPASASTQRHAAPVEKELKAPQRPSPFSTDARAAIATAPVPHPRNEGCDEPCEAVPPMRMSLSCGEDSPASPHAPNERNLPQWASPADHCETPEVCARKDVPHGSHPFSAAGGSSVSSAFLSSSLFLCVSSQSPTSALSTARSAETDMCDLHSSTRVSGSSGCFFYDVHRHSREITCLVSAVCTPLTQSTSCLTPTPAPKPSLTRSLALRTLGSSSDGMPCSTQAPHGSAAQGMQVEVERVIAATPPSAR